MSAGRLASRLRRIVRPYAALAALSLRRKLSERAALAVRAAFLGLFVLIFARVWRVVLPAQHEAGHGATEYVWYLAVTEWVALSQPWLHLEIERDVRSGEVVSQLTRPMSYVAAKIAEALGELALNLLVLAVAAAGFAYALGGGLPHDARGLLLALPLGVIAAVLAVLCRALIGLCAFWIVDCGPINWVWQKAIFLLGGLYVPLELYPGWLRTIALASPCAAMLYGPGRMAFGFEPATAAAVCAQLLGWTALVIALLATTYQRGLRALDAHGGG